MKTKLTLLILIVSTLCVSAAPPITVMGTSTNDTFKASFWNQKSNANKTITGLNTYGTSPLGTNLMAGYLPNWSALNPSAFASTNGLLSTNMFSAKGDIVVWDGTNAVRFPKGTNNQMIIYDDTTATGLRVANQPSGGGGSTNGFINTNIFSAKGDIIVWDGTNAVKLAPGTNGQMIVYDSTTATGLRTTNPPTGGSGVAATNLAVVNTDITIHPDNGSISNLFTFSLATNLWATNQVIVFEGAFEFTQSSADSMNFYLGFNTHTNSEVMTSTETVCFSGYILRDNADVKVFTSFSTLTSGLFRGFNSSAAAADPFLFTISAEVTGGGGLFDPFTLKALRIWKQ